MFLGIYLFARKTILLHGAITEDDIENEMRAVSNLCMTSTHKNIVSVFHYGPLSHYIYFIHMEIVRPQP